MRARSEMTESGLKPSGFVHQVNKAVVACTRAPQWQVRLFGENLTKLMKWWKIQIIADRYNATTSQLTLARIPLEHLNCMLLMVLLLFQAHAPSNV